jgi:prepilin signal peptidase PulO-like enzyme (type II secretory pathway)
MDADSRDAQSGDPQTGVRNGAHVSFWIRELPFSLVLILTLLGVAYTSFLKQPIMDYWELLAPVIGLVCIGSGWSSANDKSARLQLICTQALHWAAFLLVMSMILLPNVQRILNASATGLAVPMLLALGTFTACVHVLSWQVCLLGIIMALCVPAARSFRSDYRVDLGSCAWNWRCALVALT